MRKLIAFTLLVVFLFNAGGYYFVFIGLRLTSDQQISERIDQRNYSTEDVYEFKVTFSLPYPVHDVSDVQAKGEVEYNGEYYVLSEQKLVSDTIYLKGIRDTTRKELNQAFRDIASVTADAAPLKQNQKCNLQIKIIKEYKGTGSLAIISQEGWIQQLGNIHPMAIFDSQAVMEHFQPPDNLC